MKIVLLPGLDGTGRLLDNVAALLEEGSHSVLRISFSPADVSYATLKERIATALPEEDFIIVAESFSGPLAVMLAAMHPAALRGVVFVATFARRPLAVPVTMANLLNVFPIKSTAMIRIGLPLLVGRGAKHGSVDDLKCALSGVPTSTLVGRTKAALSVDVVADVKAIKPPMLYLQASKDRIVPARMAEHFWGRCRVVAIDGPHFLLQMRPERSAREILQFIDDLGLK